MRGNVRGKGGGEKGKRWMEVTWLRRTACNTTENNVRLSTPFVIIANGLVLFGL